MCGRYALSVTDRDDLDFRFRAFSAFRFQPRYNISPSQEVPIIVEKGERIIEPARFGYLPPWAKNESFAPINAMSEKVTSNMFKDALKSRRCLVPATHFYEWARTKEGKVPYLFKMKDESVFAFAGFYSLTKRVYSEDKQDIKVSFAILTTTPNEVVKPVHDRMPVILERKLEDLWLEERELKQQELERLFTPYPAEQMMCYPISTRVNSPSFDDPTLIIPE